MGQWLLQCLPGQPDLAEALLRDVVSVIFCASLFYDGLTGARACCRPIWNADRVCNRLSLQARGGRGEATVVAGQQRATLSELLRRGAGMGPSSGAGGLLGVDHASQARCNLIQKGANAGFQLTVTK